MDEIKTYELSDLDKMGFTKTVKVFICYELQPTAHPDELISSVVEGVRNATRHLPFMAGTLEFQRSGKLCIVVSPESQVEVNIRRFGSAEHKPFSILAKNSFSSNDLDFIQLLPQEVDGKSTVCALQLSLIQDGLILGFRMNHAAGDWASINMFLSLVCQSTKAYRDGLEIPKYTPDLNRAPYNTPAPDPSVSRQDLLESLPMFYVMDKGEFKPPPPPPPPYSQRYTRSMSQLFNNSRRAVLRSWAKLSTSPRTTASLPSPGGQSHVHGFNFTQRRLSRHLASFTPSMSVPET